MLKSGCKRTQIAWKTKLFTIPTSNETAIIPNIAIFKAYIISQSYSINSLNPSQIKNLLKEKILKKVYKLTRNFIYEFWKSHKQHYFVMFSLKCRCSNHKRFAQKSHNFCSWRGCSCLRTPSPSRTPMLRSPPHFPIGVSC